MGPLPTISVVTPSFNQCEYLEATLRSVLDQEYPALEYVVIDGGSTDASADIIGRYDSRLAYSVSEPDQGHADAIDKGFARTSGEIMAWINSSDLYYPWTLRTVAQVFRDVPEAQWIMGVPALVGTDGLTKAVYPSRWNIYDFLSGDYRWLQQESVFWRRDLWSASGGRVTWGADYACDFTLWLRFMRLAPLYHVQVPLAGFRHHEERRGAAEGAYSREAKEAWRQWAAKAPRHQLRRARLIAAFPGRPGRLIRQTLDALPVASWYHHLRVEYDFAAQQWSAR
jgi:glycosyltransferase involved in cell wall biosynthesis